MIAAHQTMMGPPALPYDAEVEWVGFSGAQYVDTGITPNSTTDLEITLSFDSPGSNPGFSLIGGGNGWHDNELLIVYNATSDDGRGSVIYEKSVGNNDARKNAASSLAGNFHTYRITGSQAFFDNSSLGSFTNINISTSNSVYIGAHHRNGGDVGWFLRGKVESATIWQNSIAVRDFQPVRVGSGSSAVGYLYDRVSGELFGNAGTGAFTIGPDK